MALAISPGPLAGHAELALPAARAVRPGASSTLSPAASWGCSSKPALVGGCAMVASVVAAARRRQRRTALSAEPKAKQKKVMTAQDLVRRVFRAGKKSCFTINVWYESTEQMDGGNESLAEYWRVRPFRTIEKMCNGRRACGCTWVQPDGRRGMSYFRFNEKGQIAYVREVAEPPGWRKFDTKTSMESLKGTMGLMSGIQNMFSFAEQYYEVKRNAKSRSIGLAKPRSRRADDVVRYLWDEAYPAEEDALKRVMKEYSETAVYEDMACKDEQWCSGIKEVAEYQDEMLENQPDNMQFILDELSDGDRSCVAVWHVEFGGQKSPRGLTYYETDEAGKISYARTCYDVNF